MAAQVNVALVAVLAVSVSETGMFWGVLELPVTATEMVALWVPAVSPVRLTLVVTAAVAVPVDGDSVNQVALSLAVQVMDPVPVFVTVSVCAVGLFPPTVPVNARLVGERLITGVVVDAVTVKVTGRMLLLILPFRLVSVIVTCAEYDPAARPVAVVLTEMVSVSVVIVPEEGVIVIQGALAVAIHVLSFDWVAESTTVCGDGSVPSLVAENVRELGLTCNAHTGLTKLRSIANINVVLPSILGIVCRIGAVRCSWSIIGVVLSDMKPPFAVSCFTREVSGVAWEGMEQCLCQQKFLRPARKGLVNKGEIVICRRKYIAEAIWTMYGPACSVCTCFDLARRLVNRHR